MRRTLGAVTLLVSLLAIRPAYGQETAPEEIIRRGEAAGANGGVLRTVNERAAERGLAAPERAQLLLKSVELAEQGVPAGAVLQKTLEGLAKGVPQPIMTSVLQRMQQQTLKAGSVVDTWLERPDVRELVTDAQSGTGRGREILIANLAEALIQDVPDRAVEAVLDRLPSQAARANFRAADVGTALGVLADLPTSAKDADATADLIVGALNAGFSQADLRRLPAGLMAAQQRGASAVQAAQDVTRELSTGTPAQEVLNGLFGGQHPGRAGVGGGAGPGGGPPESAGPPPGAGRPGEAQGGNDRDPPGRGNGRGNSPNG